MGKESKELLAWRKKQKRGAIMKPATFDAIVKKNEKKVGKKAAQKIAGRAYWDTAEDKYKKSRGMP